MRRPEAVIYSDLLYLVQNEDGDTGQYSSISDFVRLFMEMAFCARHNHSGRTDYSLGHFEHHLANYAGAQVKLRSTSASN